MFRLKHRVGDSRQLPLCSDGNRIENRLATPISVRTQGQLSAIADQPFGERLPTS
jgi:hypothetical protein